jgi:hypothetical protein
MRYKKSLIAQLIPVCLVLVVCLLLGTASYSQKFSENEVRAAFIFKLAKFIRWPDPTRLTFCSISESSDGDDILVSDAFESLNKSKENQFTVIKNISISKAKECSILYIDNSSANNLKDIFAQISGKPIITISSIKSFSHRGGMFGFITDNDGRIKIELNKYVAEANNISIAPSLLEIIKIVED